MNFKEKFQIMIDVIESNLQIPDKGSSCESIAKQIAQETFSNYKDVLGSFSFITNFPIGDYFKRRKLESVIREAQELTHRGEKYKLGDIACRYGYSERSSFERAFRNTYKGATATAVINNQTIVDLTTPLTIEELLEESSMNEHNENNLLRYSESSKKEKLILDLYNEEDIDLVETFKDCEMLFGMDIHQVLVVYSLLKNKSHENLMTACMERDGVRPFTDLDEYSQHQQDCLYLVVNYYLTYDEAEELVEWAEDAGIPVRELNEEYLQIIKEYDAPTGNIRDNIPHDVFLRNRQLYESLIAYGNMMVDTLGQVCEQLAAIFTKEELERPGEDIIKRMQFAVEYTYTIFDNREDIFFATDELEKADDEFKQDYKEVVESELSFAKRRITYEEYLEVKAKVNKYGFETVGEAGEYFGLTLWDYTVENVLGLLSRHFETVTENDN